MFGVGTQEVLVILLVALLLFGGKRIPEIARSLGKSVGDFRRAVNDVQREVDLELLKDSATDEARRRPARPAKPRPAARQDEAQKRPESKPPSPQSPPSSTTASGDRRS